jgi:hypothetical protein
MKRDIGLGIADGGSVPTSAIPNPPSEIAPSRIAFADRKYIHCIKDP